MYKSHKRISQDGLDWFVTRCQENIFNMWFVRDVLKCRPSLLWCLAKWTIFLLPEYCATIAFVVLNRLQIMLLTNSLKYFNCQLSVFYLKFWEYSGVSMHVVNIGRKCFQHVFLYGKWACERGQRKNGFKKGTQHVCKLYIFM